MALFTRRIAYDRKRLLTGAERLASGRRYRHSIRLYRQLLAAEPRNPDLHAALAPLLARAGRVAESWDSFEIAREAYAQAGRETEAHVLIESAAASLPGHLSAARNLSALEVARQTPKAALRILWRTEQRLRRRRGRRGEAILLLRDAREIDAWNAKIVLELGRLLSKEGRAPEALFLLDEFERRASSEELRAVRFLIWRIEPSLRHGWSWLRTERPSSRGVPSGRRFETSPAPVLER